MTFLAEILGVLKNLVAILAITVPATWALWRKVRSRSGYVSWRKLGSSVESLHSKMKEVNFRPDGIVCLGRAGSIVGSILSERFGRPLVPVAILSFDYPKGSRTESERHFNLRAPRLVNFASISDAAENVLVIGIDVFSGTTMRQAVEELEQKGVSVAGTACLFWNPDALLKPTFFVHELTVRARFPWNLETFREKYGLG